MILNPIGISKPANTQSGMCAASFPNPSNTVNKNRPCMIPDTRVFPPAFIFTTVPLVAPAPGIPPMIAASIFPIPCPISSRLLLCLVFVILSAITEVSRESMLPNTARTIAYSMMVLNALGSISSIPPSCKEGSPAGISPIRGTSILVK